jgi:hypothetical protein
MLQTLLLNRNQPTVPAPQPEAPPGMRVHCPYCTADHPLLELEDLNPGGVLIYRCQGVPYIGAVGWRLAAGLTCRPASTGGLAQLFANQAAASGARCEEVAGAAALVSQQAACALLFGRTVSLDDPEFVRFTLSELERTRMARARLVAEVLERRTHNREEGLLLLASAAAALADVLAGEARAPP